MITTSQSIKSVSAALLKFQGAVEGVGKNSTNPGYNSKYANLETVVDTARPELQAVGVVFLQSGGAIVEGVMAMSTRLIHAESGEWIEGTMDIALGKRDPQGVGSAQTYAQRYHLMAMLGLPPVDDDGEAAIDRDNKRPKAPSEPVQTNNGGEVPPISRIDGRPHYDALAKGLKECETLKQMQGYWERNAPIIKTLPSDWQLNLTDFKNQLKDEFLAKQAATI